MLSQSMRSGGAGAPPAGTMTGREELADGVGESPSQKRGPDAEKTSRWRARRRRTLATRCAREQRLRRVARHPLVFEGDKKDRPCPGLDKEQGRSRTLKKIGCLKIESVRHERATYSVRARGSGDPALKAAKQELDARFRGHERSGSHPQHARDLFHG